MFSFNGVTFSLSSWFLTFATFSFVLVLAFALVLVVLFAFLFPLLRFRVGICLGSFLFLLLLRILVLGLLIMPTLVGVMPSASTEFALDCATEFDLEVLVRHFSFSSTSATTFAFSFSFGSALGVVVALVISVWAPVRGLEGAFAVIQVLFPFPSSRRQRSKILGKSPQSRRVGISESSVGSGEEAFVQGVVGVDVLLLEVVSGNGVPLAVREFRGQVDKFILRGHCVQR